MVACANYKPVASPRYFLLGRERGVSEFLAKLPRWLFLAPADFAAVNHHVMLVSDAIDSDRTERQIIKAHAKHYGPYEGLIPSWPLDPNHRSG
jgi:hypothetical protein